jgi:hypothetical protein
LSSFFQYPAFGDIKTLYYIKNADLHSSGISADRAGGEPSHLAAKQKVSFYPISGVALMILFLFWTSRLYPSITPVAPKSSLRSQTQSAEQVQNH